MAVVSGGGAVSSVRTYSTYEQIGGETPATYNTPSAGHHSVTYKRRMCRGRAPARGRKAPKGAKSPLTISTISAIFFLWLEPTNRQLSRGRGNTMILCRVREIRHYIASTAEALVGSRHEGFFTIRMWLPNAGDGIPGRIGEV